MSKKIAGIFSISLLILVGTLCTILIAGGCSTKKTGWAHRTYHNLNSRFNGYFNSKEIIKFDELEMEKNVEDDYDKMLPVFKSSVEENREFMMSNMETVIEKCTRVINLHSIERRGKEHVEWIDDCYFLMGKANFYKGEFLEAKKFFEFVSKKFKDKNSALPSMVWLARTHVEREDYEKAERVLRLVEAESELEEEYVTMARLITADLFIRQKNYPLAIPELRLAIDEIRKKRVKSRLIFLMGQMYKEMGEYDNASKEFTKVVDINLNYREVFFARIERAMCYDGEGGGEKVREELLDMLDDEKYIEFRDRIYYALAEMDYNEGNLEAAKENLKKSTAASMGDTKQKGRSFLKLADIYFAEPSYEPAQMYYDSTVQFLDPKHERYEELVKLAENLTELVKHINVITEQDSLQRLAQMSPKEREKIFDKVIREREERERREQAELEAAEFRREMGLDDGDGMQQLPGMGGGGKWYFYNPQTVAAGEDEFKRIWGTRQNEDDWRRSDKRQVQNYEDLNKSDADTAGFIVDESGDTIEISNDWREYSYYLKDLPLTEEKRAASDTLIMEAYYQKGIVYREKLDDHEKSIETFEELNQRFPEHMNLASTYYRLYRMNDEIHNDERAEYYKNKVLNEFPDTDYAKIILDPSFLERENELLKEATVHYEKTYGFFKRELYAVTIENAREGMEVYGETTFGPKFELIYALSVGKEQGRDAMIMELQTVKNKNDTVDKDISQEAQAYLEAIQAVEKREAEENAPALEESPYEYDANERHLFIVLLPADGSVNTRSLRMQISDFNRKNYRTKNLQLSPIQFNDELQMVSVKDFSDADKAINYYRAFSKNKGNVKDLNDAEYIRFVVSYTNYATMYKEKDLDTYIRFFKENYKKAAL